MPCLSQGIFVDFDVVQEAKVSLKARLSVQELSVKNDILVAHSFIPLQGIYKISKWKTFTKFWEKNWKLWSHVLKNSKYENNWNYINN